MANTEGREERRNRWLADDVVAMLKERRPDMCENKDYYEFAHDLITVVRERVLEEIGSVVRERTRR